MPVDKQKRRTGRRGDNASGQAPYPSSSTTSTEFALGGGTGNETIGDEFRFDDVHSREMELKRSRGEISCAECRRWVPTLYFCVLFWSGGGDVPYELATYVDFRPWAGCTRSWRPGDSVYALVPDPAWPLPPPSFLKARIPSHPESFHGLGSPLLLTNDVVTAGFWTQRRLLLRRRKRMDGVGVSNMCHPSVADHLSSVPSSRNLHQLLCRPRNMLILIFAPLPRLKIKCDKQVPCQSCQVRRASALMRGAIWS